MFDPVHLRTLREFHLRGTVAEVAHSLDYTPSAVSQQLAALERTAGVTLTRKVGRRLVLTPAGESLAASAESVLAALETARAAMRATSGHVTGTVHLALFQSAALALLPSALEHLGAHAPALRVHVTQSEPAEALRDTWAREFDLVVAEEYPHHSAPHYDDVVRHTLVRDEIRLATASAHQGAQLDRYAHTPWVMEPPGAASRHYAEQQCRIAGFEPDVRFETADLQAHVALVSAGQAVALLPDLMAADARAELTLHTLPHSPRRTVFAATRASSQADPATAAVVDALAQAARQVHPDPEP